jgi:hypothetical protein
MSEGTVPPRSSSKEAPANDASLWRLASMRLRRDGDPEALHASASTVKGRETDLDEGEEQKMVNHFGKPMEPTLSTQAKDTIANGSTPTSSQVLTGETLDEDGALTSSKETKIAFPEMMAKIAEEERSTASTQGRPSAQADSSVTANSSEEKGGPVLADTQSSLSALSRHDIGRHVVRGLGDQKEASEGAKTEGEKKTTSHKVAKKASTTETPAIGAGMADQQNGPTINVSQMMLQGSSTPVSAGTNIADTPVKDKDASTFDISASGAPGRSRAEKMQVSKAAETSQGSKVEDASDPDVSSGSEKISGTEVHPTTVSVADTAQSESSVVHGTEKNHLQVEMPGATAATGPQIQTHTITSSAVDKSVLNTLHATKDQEDSVSTMNHLYAGGDGQKELVATPTSIEVGVPGGAHGWLKVRAELTNDGSVHASMSASSNTGTEMLRRELPSITNFLHQEHVSVSSVVVHASSGSMNHSDSSNGGAAGYNRETGQGTSDTRNGAGQENRAMSRGEDSSLTGAAEEGGVEDLPSIEYGGAGGWLSVRA